MKALIVDGRAGVDGRAAGSSGQDRKVAEALESVERELKGNGWETRVERPSAMNVRYCTGCFQCWTRTPGQCAQKDDVAGLLRELVRSDLLVFVSPIRWGCYTPELKALLERTIPTLLPFFEVHDGEVHHKMRYAKQPWFVAIGVSAGAGGGPGEEKEAQVFRKLYERNLKNFRTERAAFAVLGTDDPGPVSARIRETLGEIGVGQ